MGLFKRKISRLEFLKDKAKKDTIFALSYVRELLARGNLKEAEKFEKKIEGENLVYARYLMLKGEREKALIVLAAMFERDPSLLGVAKLMLELSEELQVTENMERAKNLLKLFGYYETMDLGESEALSTVGSDEEVIVIEDEPISLDTARYYFEQCLFDEAENILLDLLSREDSTEARELLERVRLYKNYLVPREP